MAARVGKPAGGAGEHHDVVVVGAGVSGLATAWHLRDRDVLVLEETDRVGGRIRSERRGDTWLNFGAHVYGGDGTALPLSARSRAALVRAGLKLRYDVARYDRMIRPRPGESPAERQLRVVNFMDDESFSERIGPLPPDVDAMFRCTLTRSSGEPEELAAGYGVGYFHLVWDRSSGLSRGIVGGPSTMIERLASMTPKIRCGARATLVEESGDGVRVRYEDGGEHVVTAAAAVLAVPAPVVAELAPGLPARRGQGAAPLGRAVRGRDAGPLVRHGLQHRQRAVAARRAAAGAQLGDGVRSGGPWRAAPPRGRRDDRAALPRRGAAGCRLR